jgi:hypothetical protein
VCFGILIEQCLFLACPLLMEQCLLACGGRRVGLPSFCTVVLGPLFSRGTQISVRAVRHLLGAPLGITQFVCFGILIEQCCLSAISMGL